MKVRRASCWLLLACTAAMPVVASDLSVVTHDKPKGCVIDSQRLADGNVEVLQLQRRNSQQYEVLSIGPEGALRAERVVEGGGVAVFLADMSGVVGVGVHDVDKKITTLTAGEQSWVLAGLPQDVQILNESGQTFIAAMRYQGGRPPYVVDAWKFAGGALSAVPSGGNEKGFSPRDLFSSERALYAVSRDGLYGLSLRADALGLKRILRDRFNKGAAVSVGGRDIAALIKSKMMVQNEVEIRSLPDGKLLEKLKFPYSVASTAFAGGGDGNALLMVKSKESVNEAELIALDENGRVIGRAKTDYRSTLASGAHAGKAVMVGVDRTSVVSIPHGQEPGPGQR